MIGGRGEKRTLRLVARFASMWDAQFVEEEQDEWRRLRDVLWGHCADVGRDPIGDHPFLSSASRP